MHDWSDAAAIVEADELFHTPVEGADDWTETSWWGFYAPERKLSGMFYNLWRVGAGVAASNVWVWDDTGEYPYEMAYCRPLWHLPLPADPTNFELASGLSCERIAPLKSHRFRYVDPGLLELDLTTQAIDVPCNTFPGHGPGTGHFDQHMRVRGRLNLRGEEIAVDCISMRDRTWSPRSELTARRLVGPYAHGATGPGEAFLLSAMAMGEAMMDGRVQNLAVPGSGYLKRDGVTSRLVEGKRTVLHRVHGRPTQVLLEATDALGRALQAEGECLNHAFVALSANIPCRFSLTRWTLAGGQTAWGENQEAWLPGTAYRDFLVSGGANF